jgi:hypothetical protein
MRPIPRMMSTLRAELVVTAPEVVDGEIDTDIAQTLDVAQSRLAFVHHCIFGQFQQQAAPGNGLPAHDIHHGIGETFEIE